MENRVFSKEIIESFKEDYSNWVTLSDMAKKYKISAKAISKTLKENGVNVLQGSRKSNNRYFNFSAFSDFTQELQAYLYGFLLGDGCLHIRKDSGKGTIILGINQKDIEIIEMLKKYLNSTNKISKTSCFLKSTNKTYHGISFNFSNDEVIKRLVEQGYAANKSSKEVLPKDILKESRNFWRGLFDADGSVFFQKNTKSPSISLIGSLEITKGFAAFVKENTGDWMKLSSHSSDNVYYISATGDRARRIVELLYKDCKYSLSRKKTIADEVIATIVTSKMKTSKAQPIITKQGKYSMQVGVGKTTVRLGIFESFELAINARDNFVLEINNKTLEKLNGNSSRRV